MAFQYSGTALDVAIQQREQEVDAEPPVENSPDETPTDKSIKETSQAPEIESPQELSPSVMEPPAPATEVKQETKSSASTADSKSEPIKDRPPQRSVSLITGRKSKAPIPATAPPDLQAFISRWKPFLTDTQIGICSYIYNNSVAKDREYCFTSTAKLMEAVSKTERQVKTVLSQLIDWEFLIKGETIVNAPREKRGTFYRLDLDKS
jgi:hypothetical protein